MHAYLKYNITVVVITCSIRLHYVPLKGKKDAVAPQ